MSVLDGTHIEMHLVEKEKVRYRNRKEDFSTNVLGVCSQDLQFIYILLGWEGSAHNRALRDALCRKKSFKSFLR